MKDHFHFILWPKREFDALVRSIAKGCPFGESAWRDRLAARLGLQYTLRDPGRPKVAEAADVRPVWH